MNHPYGKKKYYRIKLEKRTIWAATYIVKGNTHIIIECKEDGDTWYGQKAETQKATLAAAEDIKWVKPARMNLHYGKLEVIDE